MTIKGQQPVPVSGERVMLPPERSMYAKAPKPLTPEKQIAQDKAGASRRSWESSPEGVARTRDAAALHGAGANTAQIYQMNRAPSVDPGPRHYDTQLPGMSNPQTAPRPPKWEELSDEHRAHAEQGLAKYGTSVQQMTQDYGAQLDQAHHRAWSARADRPFTEDFYSVGEPRKVIDRSAAELGIPPTVHAQMNAFTSPNTKFSQNTPSGETAYPNDTAAKHAVKWVQQGGDPEAITNSLSDTGLGTQKAQGYTTNIRKAAKAFAQHEQGVEPADWVTGSGAKDSGPFDASPKTGPYANSWNDSHPQFFVSDVHSGGGGMLPHLGSEKPVKLTASGQQVIKDGKPVRDKSEREVALSSVPYFHSAADYAARQVHTERGIGSTRSGQAAQWGEEQLQRGERDGARGFPKPADAYPAPKRATVNPDQFKLF